MSKHTPGPWEVDGWMGGVRVKSERHVIADCVVRTDTLDEAEEADANARLIAAAPVLLKTLRDIMDNCDCTTMLTGPCANCQRAEAAIEQAEPSITKELK